MSRIIWDKPEERFFESSVDRGVFYPSKGYGEAWNGLVNVAQNADGGGATPYYVDGYKFLNEPAPEEFSGSIEAYTYPEGFAKVNGDHTNGTGLIYGQQDREEFGLSYRTFIGNAVDSRGDYKIHLLYNVLAAPSTETYATDASTVDPLNFNWPITTRGVRISGRKPTAELIIDTRYVSIFKKNELEQIIYGDSDNEPRLPDIWEVVEIFDDWPNVEIVQMRVSGLNKLKYKGYPDLKGNNQRGLYRATDKTRLTPTTVDGLYRI